MRISARLSLFTVCFVAACVVVEADTDVPLSKSQLKSVSKEDLAAADSKLNNSPFGLRKVHLPLLSHFCPRDHISLT